ncbi:Alpha/Beta hydrolase protein [Gigaspora rosea]|uniref:Alpha/Beta hydrolase protein n=1 Tax=Gigaspora rosea TaxID=44941 RepID=A0A397VRW4_9GLOM|nr:Alpha/Beta hydrolase protein [Gigaspora rosea]
MADAIKFIFPKIPNLISTIINHYKNGPPKPSWNLIFHLALVTTRLTLDSLYYTKVEDVQRFTSKPVAISSGFAVDQVRISNEYRKNAQQHIDNLLKEYEHLIDDEWNKLDNLEELSAEWIYIKENGFMQKEDKRIILYLHGGAYIMCSTGSHRNITSSIAKAADAHVFAINYRLAPQNQFPAALHDALAAYLYLTNPPKDAGFSAINPKQIVIMGDSAGGGLTIATLLALRDSGLPMVAGAVGWSPWVDLTHSMPSILSKECDKSDYLPPATLQFLPSQAQSRFFERSAALAKKIKQSNKPRIWHESLDREVRVNQYAANESLSLPYISPLCAESLGGLPPMLLTAGDGERLRDEIIYFAFKASQPSKYLLPIYNAGKFEISSFKTPSNVTLEIYEDMPHVFQLFGFNESTPFSFQRAAEFIREAVASASEKSTSNKITNSSNYVRISANKQVFPLNESDYSVLEWQNVGCAPTVEAPIKTPMKTPNEVKIRPLDIIVYIVAILAIISYLS